MLHLSTTLRTSNNRHLTDLVHRRFPITLVSRFRSASPIRCHVFRDVCHVRRGGPRYKLFLVNSPGRTVCTFHNTSVCACLHTHRTAAKHLRALNAGFHSDRNVIGTIGRIFRHTRLQRAKHNTFLFHRSDNRGPIPFLPIRSRNHGRILRVSKRDITTLGV